MKEEHDYSKGRRGAVVPPKEGRTRVTIQLDGEVLNWLREEVNNSGGGSYSELINEVLRRRTVAARMDYRPGIDVDARIVCDPEVLAGKPTIKGMRLSVSLVLELLAAGESEAGIVDSYPGLTHEDIAACLLYAARCSSAEE